MGRPRIQHQVVDGVEYKRCGCCQQWQPLHEFGASKAAWDGLRGRCRTCSRRDDLVRYRTNPDRERLRTRAYVDANRGIVRARDRARYEANPQRGREKRKVWYEANPDYARQYARDYSARNRDLIAEKAKLKRLADPEAARARFRRHHRMNAAKRAAQGAAASRARRARRRELPREPYTEAQIIERDGFSCWLCAGDVGAVTFWDGRRDWVVEHLIPLSAEFPEHPGDVLCNVAIACAPCNQWKYNAVLPAAVARYQQNVRHAAS